LADFVDSFKAEPKTHLFIKASTVVCKAPL